ncbi:hypothetical protein BEWA_034200 [Theileria equi strain WA]|uniref:Uncharacterized protein n=1 Tax=Theileria equi strain WA TaxID=1537102 RepID=L0AZ82_THEEQ|nr:hypothetical protein BEWA_034200 [Theileria equi strain WA]AFZ80563.1 hypothetical protein BEWA_034200 [Theileria equi strain WA]|eukprot:XP_004830229.1 hypothetical protein BEWA_034200 [Theileria equi strain WA]
MYLSLLYNCLTRCKKWNLSHLRFSSRRLGSIPNQRNVQQKTTINDFGLPNVDEVFVPGITTDPFYKDITLPKRCIGCGSLFQTTDSTKPGYVDAQVLNESSVRGNLKLPSIRGAEAETVPEGIEIMRSEPGRFSAKKRRVVCRRCYKLQVLFWCLNQLLQYYKRVDMTSEVDVQRENIAREMLGIQDGIKRGDTQRIFTNSSSKDKGTLQMPTEVEASHAKKSLNLKLSSEIITDLAVRIKNDSVVIFLIDLTNLEASVIPELYIALRNRTLDVIWVANKVDVIPKPNDPTEIKRWLRSFVRQIGNAKSADVILVSSTKGIGLDVLEHRMKAYLQTGNPRNIYVVGATNVGKSTFVNRFLDFIQYNVGGTTRSAIPGTTLEFIEFGLPKGFKLVDTPGIPIPSQVPSLLYRPIDLLSISIMKTINPLSIKLEAGRSLLVGGLARVDLVQGSSTIVQCFFSSGITIKVCRSVAAEDILKHQVGTSLYPPHDKEDFEKLLPLSKYRFAVNCTGRRPVDEFVISGLGWISFCGIGPKIIEMYIPRGINLLRRPAMLTTAPKTVDGYKIYHGR